MVEKPYVCNACGAQVAIVDGALECGHTEGAAFEPYGPMTPEREAVLLGLIEKLEREHP